MNKLKGFKGFAKDYIYDLNHDLLTLDLLTLEKIAEKIWETYQNDKTIFFIGNGGSAATAAHMVNDFCKGTLGHKGDGPWKRFRAMALSESTPLLTAWANDTGYENIFAEQLKTYGQPGDLLIAVTSGGSENIILAAKAAKKIGMPVIGLATFPNKELKNHSDICLGLDHNHYGRLEDVHLILNHIFVNYFYKILKENHENSEKEKALTQPEKNQVIELKEPDESSRW